MVRQHTVWLQTAWLQAKKRSFYVLVCMLSFFFATQVAAKKLVVSNHPLYLLALEATEGVETPIKLMRTDAGHHYQLTPSDRRMLHEADFIFWFGDELESPLAKTLNNHPKALALLRVNNLKPKVMRDLTGHVINNKIDPHIWLDPEKAKAIVRIIAAVRALQNPQHQAQYQKNSDQFAAKMDRAIARIGTQQKHYYLPYHDAYQYIEPALGLVPIGSVTYDMHMPVNAKQLLWLKQRIENKRKQVDNNQQALCVASEAAQASTRLSVLKPIEMVEINETLLHANQFIEGWQAVADKLLRCGQKSVLVRE